MVDLTGACDKFKWAKRHFEDFHTAVGRWQERNPYEFAIETNETDGSFKVTFVENEPPELTFPLMVGDIVHNLRSTLDHIVYALAKQTRRSPRTQFPVYVDRDDYWELTSKGGPSGRDRWLSGVPESDRAIIDRLQPHNAGDAAADQPLALLTYLSNIDKHRHLLVGFVIPSGALVRISVGDEQFELTDMAMEPGAIVAEGTVQTNAANANVNVHGSAQLTIGFSERHVTVADLALIGNEVKAILDGFLDRHAEVGERQPGRS